MRSLAIGVGLMLAIVGAVLWLRAPERRILRSAVLPGAWSGGWRPGWRG